MISIQLQGGLGNQLFQIAHLIAYCKTNNKQYAFPDYYRLHDRITYWNTLLSNLKPFLIPKDSIKNMHIEKECGFHYQQFPDLGDNFVFHGYFQSWKYFHHQRDSILHLLQFQKQQEEEFLLDDIDPVNSISMHFRIGDYKNLKEVYPTLGLNYYKRAIQYFESMEIPFTVYYFYEIQDHVQVEDMIQHLKEHHPQFRFVSGIQDREDWQQLLFMSRCGNHIIANSTFSWWGAYLSSEQGIIIYPSTWFCENIGYNTSDLFPYSWIKI